MKKEILAMIPARGGSKGIKRKNLLPIEGIPLIQYTIDAAKGSKYIARCIVNSDDEEILEYARRQGVEVLERPMDLAQDNTSMKDVIIHQLEYLKNKERYCPDIFVLLQPTSPLRTAHHIDAAMENMLSKDCDALVSVEEEPHLHSPFSVMQINKDGYLEFFLKEGQKFTSRQEKPRFYARNGAAIYAVKVEAFLETGSLYGTKCVPYVMPIEDSVDIDSMLDVYVLKAMMQYKRDQMCCEGINEKNTICC